MMRIDLKERYASKTYVLCLRLLIKTRKFSDIGSVLGTIILKKWCVLPSMVWKKLLHLRANKTWRYYLLYTKKTYRSKISHVKFQSEIYKSLLTAAKWFLNYISHSSLNLRMDTFHSLASLSLWNLKLIEAEDPLRVIVRTFFAF